MINKKLIAVLVASIIFAASVIAIDLSGFTSYEIPRYFDGTSKGENIYIVYQDYRNLYSSVALVEWNTSTREVTTKLIVESGWDNVRPKIFRFQQDLIVGWFEVREGTNKFGYAVYNLASETLDEKITLDIAPSPFTTDYSFDGAEFTIGTASGSQFKVWVHNVARNATRDFSIPINGTVQALAVEGSTIYYALYYDNSTHLNIYNNSIETEIASVDGKIIALSGYNNHMAWLEQTGEVEPWGCASFSNGNLTASFEMATEGDLITLIEVNGIAYLSWTEYLEEESDDDSNFEVRVARISNLTNPEFALLGEASELDGRLSANQFFVDSENGLWLFWNDRLEDYSFRAARVNEWGLEDETVLLENGELGFLLTFGLIMGVIMGTMFAFMGMIRKNAKKAAPKTAANRKFDIDFKFYNRLESYFFLKHRFSPRVYVS